jgi:hypothetical protein
VKRRLHPRRLRSCFHVLSDRPGITSGLPSHKELTSALETRDYPRFRVQSQQPLYEAALEPRWKDASIADHLGAEAEAAWAAFDDRTMKIEPPRTMITRNGSG